MAHGPAPGGAVGAPPVHGFTLRPRPADGEATSSEWEKPGPQLPEKWEGKKTQDHAPNVQTLGPPELESKAQGSACLGDSRGTLTPVNAVLVGTSRVDSSPA